MANPITQGTIKQLQAKPPVSGNKVVWDAGKGSVTGFGVRITAGGSVAFVLRYVTDGRERRITLGKHPDLTVSAARDEAAKMRGRITGGADPLREREARRRLPTMEALCDRYVKEHLEVHNKPRTQEEFKRLVEKRIKPKLGHHKITALARSDITAWFHDMRETPTEANRSLAVLRKMLSLAVTEWELRDDNPARSIKLYTEKKRERVLTDAELKRLAETVDAMVEAGEVCEGVANCVWLLATTGCRLSEVLALRWEDVDLGARTLTIRDGKAGGRLHPVGAAVATKLKTIKREGPWVVWSVDPQAPMSINSMEHYWQRIRERAMLPDFRLHDLRHGYGTAAGHAGANAFLVRDALGHKTLAMTGRYVNKGDAVQELANRVAGRLDAVWSGKSTAKIEKLSKHRGTTA